MLCDSEMYFSIISIDKSGTVEEKSPKAVCVQYVFQIHSRVPSLAVFTRPAE